MTAEWAYGGSEGGVVTFVMGIAIIACKTQGVVDFSFFFLRFVLIFSYHHFAIEASGRHLVTYFNIVVDMLSIPRS